MKTRKSNFKKELARVRRFAANDKADRALGLLERMLTYWPKNPTLLVEKSRLIQLSEHGELGEAKRALQQAAELGGESPTPWIELGFFRLCVDDRARDAEAKFDRAIGLGLGLLTEATRGKIDAVLDQAPDVLPAATLVEAASLLQLAQFVSQRHPQSESLEARKLREGIADLKRRMHAARNMERNGS